MTSHDDMNEVIRTAFSASKKAQTAPADPETAQEPRRRVNADAGEGNLPENDPEPGGAWARAFNDAVRKAARR
ncbi:hypothetical protein [Nocardioides piscis]|uniref:Uncharacterized protein n=1 Tax=Nocardioides piscis TaxID=2714938 RepID=A0A6G7YGV3_9ACTN|nr:hypothetical protein [Nocardioides piscis]QIK76045.1 hypothetical protein G7071_11975 [Nocardioides piscis]